MIASTAGDLKSSGESISMSTACPSALSQGKAIGEESQRKHRYRFEDRAEADLNEYRLPFGIVSGQRDRGKKSTKATLQSEASGTINQNQISFVAIGSSESEDISTKNRCWKQSKAKALDVPIKWRSSNIPSG